jgi:hypothetical protein
MYLVIARYYESIELNFMIPGHTKFKCDSSFELIKRLYCKTTVDCINHVADVVKRSSIFRLNKVWHYNGFQYFDIISGLKTYFKKLFSLQKFQHFIFTSANSSVVKAQEIANGTFQEFKLLNINQSTTNKVLEKLGPYHFQLLYFLL